MARTGVFSDAGHRNTMNAVKRTTLAHCSNAGHRGCAGNSTLRRHPVGVSSPRSGSTAWTCASARKLREAASSCRTGPSMYGVFTQKAECCRLNNTAPRNSLPRLLTRAGWSKAKSKRCARRRPSTKQASRRHSTRRNNACKRIGRHAAASVKRKTTPVNCPALLTPMARSSCSSRKAPTMRRRRHIQRGADQRGAGQQGKVARSPGLLTAPAETACAAHHAVPMQAISLFVILWMSKKVCGQDTGHQRCTASAVSNGPVLKQIRACGACSWTTFSTCSNSRKFLPMVRTPAPITTQS